MNSQFRIIEHTIPCSSIREYHHAVKTDRLLQLAIKQYISLNNHNPSRDDISIIAGHANGIPKECYEPLWDDLLRTFEGKIKAIWFADCSNQGTSGVLNEDNLGDDHLLGMVNHFSDQIKPPIVGVAHSFSCSQFVHVCIMHPRLFHSLISLEPMIQVESPSKLGGRSPVLWASTRPDLWSSEHEAEKYIRSNPFWRRWDSRAVDKYIQYGLRALPTALYPLNTPGRPLLPGAVTLTTTKAQEAWTYLRLNATPQIDGNDKNGALSRTERFLSPDLALSAKEGDNNNRNYVTICPWSCIAFELLSYVRPPVFFIFGGKSHINIPARRQDKLDRIGTGLGGGGQVQAEVVLGASHMAPLQRVHDTACRMSDWLDIQLKAYREEAEFWMRHDSKKSEQNGRALSAQWMEYVQSPVDTKRERGIRPSHL
ncbi:toxin biosynthesis protein [Aspergillus japonicus CBS 114.51]|uniref:Toxin biosynthesis protein n=1 Tax=Aspergillus japonicus CBS 114.51 TaxID=1448312 RepID=A0A8T8X6J0_ASPJA|nr:toxin biosynthesis protein [Aspergillus japonicus CBS 114.51]RAH83272.1 toxin biosynthesis protein [Aspergillus japonicus CBS 114.51]